ncbi:MAG TPA: hypothetical protein VGR14_22580 [Verrucomicrobiae bacterium]|jgi:hypothetical protein|nr:hypothetical protein [Verrucomicrobiae bacterium]
METKNREKLLLLATGATVALWLLNLLVISPLTDSWHGRSDEIDKLKKEIADGAGIIRRETTIRNRWDFMRANALNSNPTMAERQLFTSFDRWAKTGGVAQGSFRPQFDDSDTNFMTVECRSDVSGSPNNVRDFLRAMSKDPLANKLDSFVLTTKDDNGRQLTLDLNMSGLVLTDSVPAQAAGMADGTPPGRDTNSAGGLESGPFQLITRNNIFDQSRFPNEGIRPPTVPAKRVDVVTYCGTGIDSVQRSAIFDGSGVRSGHDYKVGESIDDLKIASITFNTVTLTNAGSNTFVVPVGTSLRREDNGAWQLSAAVAVTPPPNATSAISASTDSVPGGGGNNILEMLRKRREQEEK